MADTLEHGRRPFVRDATTVETGEAMSVCPGVRLEHGASKPSGVLEELLDAWGPVLAVWEGYAADSEIRFAGSSGGAASALALYCIDREGMSGALHIGARSDVPYLNETSYSADRADLLARTGSRYAPASPCDGLQRVEDAEGKSIFIGKPCDVAAAKNAAKLRPKLAEKIGLAIAFFCAGTPSTKGTLDLLASQGVADPAQVSEIRYRGNGWPGLWNARVSRAEGKEDIHRMTYSESWGFLQKYRQWRCYICPDHTGEFSDISVGDPWYREVQEGEVGKSLIVARTILGLNIVRSAASAGYLVLESSSPALLPRSQPSLIESRGLLWARLGVLRLLSVPVPVYSGFPMFKFWLRNLGPRAKFQSISGTLKRVFSKHLQTPIVPKEWIGGRPK